MDNRLNHPSFIEEESTSPSVERREEDDLNSEPSSLSTNKLALVITFGCLSFISTLLVIFIIIRSRKEGKVYHRVMLVKSLFGDLLFSAALTLTTIPMPRDVGNIYNFPTKSFGTVATCSAQAFTLLFGLLFTCCGTLLLYIYYLCTMRFHISEESFRKHAEPIFLLLSIPTSLTLPLVLLRADLLNPVSSENPFCGPGIFPVDCDLTEGNTCIRGSFADLPKYKHFTISYVETFCATLLITLLISMGLIVSYVNRASDIDEEVDRRFVSEKRRNFIVWQALGYIAVCLSTWLVLGASILVNTRGNLWVMSLLGFLNMVLFVSHGIYSHRDVTTDSFYDALKIMILSPYRLKEHGLIENMTAVDTMNALERLRRMSEENEKEKQEHIDNFCQISSRDSKGDSGISAHVGSKNSISSQSDGKLSAIFSASSKFEESDDDGNDTSYEVGKINSIDFTSLHTNNEVGQDLSSAPQSDNRERNNSSL